MKRRGFMLYELIAASVLLAVMAMVCLQFVRASAQRRRAAHEQLAAVQEASNLLERLSARPRNDLTSAAARDVKLSPQAAKTLPDAVVEVKIGTPSGAPPAKQIVVLVRWHRQADMPAQSVRLVAWKYQGSRP